MSHNPVDDEYKQYTLAEFVEVAKKELDDYQSQSNDAHVTTHTWDEWMGSFKRYMSW